MTRPTALCGTTGAVMTDVGVDRPVRVTDEKGRPQLGILHWSVRHKGGYLINIVNYRSYEFPVRIVAPDPIERITNLFTGRRAPDFFELAPLEPFLLFVETAG